MVEYRVTKPILKGRTIDNPNTYSKKVIAKVGTILVAERDDNRIGVVVVLRKKNGDYVCDLDSQVANEHCIKC